MYEAFVVNSGNPIPFLSLITTHPKTIFQTGQLGSILLTDALMVYRTFVLWNSNFYTIVFPCLTFVATFSELLPIDILLHLLTSF